MTTSAAPPSAPPPLNATLLAREELDPRNALFRVRPDAGVPDFLPGQFVQLGLHVPASADAPGGLLQRAYSIASAPAEREGYEFLLALVDGGRLTSRLWELAPGARLWCDPRPQGHFTLERIPPGRDLVFVATGTGLAPYRSMLRAFRDRWPFGKCALVHGARTAPALAWRGELEGLERELPGFRYLPILSREPAGTSWEGARGRVQQLLAPERFAALAGFPLDPERCTLFLCGNPAMIAELREELAPLGFTLDTRRRPGSIRLERYW